MPQIGIYSAYQLGLHNHLNNTQGGILNDYSRYGAYRRPYRTGALAVHCDNDAEVFTGNAIYTLLKEILVNTDQVGEYRISWQQRSSVFGQDSRTRFYVNGVAVSAEMTEGTNVYQTETHNYDVDLAAGDLLQIYGKRVGACDCYVRNFRIYYDWRIAYFGDGTVLNLTTPLPLSDADLLDVTNIV